MNIVVCDDNVIQLEIFKEILQDYEGTFDKKLFFAESGEEVTYYAKNEIVDVAFLDVEMEGMSGIELGRYLRMKYPECIIVFITGYKDHAISAFKVRALDYLLKPVSAESLHKIMNEIEEIYDKLSRDRDVQSYFSFSTKREQIKIPFSEIILFEKVSRKIRIYTTNGTYEYLGTFKDLVDDLDMRMFYQCHQSFIVNKTNILESSNNEIIIRNLDQHIPINRASRHAIKAIIKENSMIINE